MINKKILPEEFKKLLDLYVKSINDCDVSIAADIWNIEDRVSFIHPNGYENSFDEITEHFYVYIMQRLFVKRELVLKNIKFSIYDNTAFLDFEWDFYATSRENNKDIHTQGRESQFWVYKNNKWKITHIHYSAVNA